MMRVAITTSFRTATFALVAILAVTTLCAGAARAADHDMGGPRIAGACEAPASENDGKMGCYFDEAVEIGALQGPVFYHIDEYTDVAIAEADKTNSSAVVRAYNRVFLQTVNTDAAWRPAHGRHLATIGPMQAPEGAKVTARFMQAMTRPGATTRPHRHDGPEAFYVLSGAICLETPSGGETTTSGGTYWVGGGVPMQLTSAGSEIRRSLFVVLHASSKPWMTMAHDWTPTSACAQK